MNPKSAQTLVIAAAVLAIVGLAASPALGMFCFGLAALLAIAPAALGKGALRIAGIVALVAALGLGAATWPDYQKHTDAYRAKARK
jgi:hypothetical protein